MARAVRPPTGMLTVEQYEAWQRDSMTERALEDCVLNLAGALGWLRFHALPVTNRNGKTRTAQRGDTGFPDLVLVHPRGSLLVRELKRQNAYPTPEQRVWLAAFTAAGVDAGVWKPQQWLDGTIEARLRLIARAGGT